MKPISLMLRRKSLLLTALVLNLALPGLAAQPKTNSPAARPAPAPTNAPPVQLEIPKSVFIIPTTPQQGKDPFFPRSMRLYASVVVKTTQKPSAPQVELKLNGISGVAPRRLAIINNHTFEANEEGAVSTATGPVRIHCLEIRADSVLIQMGGEQRVLRLRPGS